ncbi:MAG TPA: 1,4-alpha-glucan branching protein GlgB [Verrucomicrobiales bacterium]|nr:1,4-alpha-glucan branching protein GlgB [Verrucomicrobiales bacterium]
MIPLFPALATDPESVEALLRADHADPFGFLGVHHLEKEGAWVFRIFRPGARRLWVNLEGEGTPRELLLIHAAGFFELVAPGLGEALPVYTLTWEDHAGVTHGPVSDPYSFPIILGELDLYYFCEGTHTKLHEKLGAQLCEIGGVSGMSFAVWAPNARRVSLVGDFNGWDGRIHPMRLRREAGVWEIFMPGIGAGVHYKFEIVGADGRLFIKTDPFAFFAQHGLQTASITWDRTRYVWGDADWMAQRATWDPYRKPVSIYEVHLGSWRRITEEGDRFLSYREAADQLVDYVVEMGFTHIELMPITEFPFDGSWGYQVCGYFAPTSRFGNPDEFRYFVDRCHQRGIGIILDWVPAHFPKDPHGLSKFDGTALYEHEDPRKGEHSDWGTLIFNYGRNEVRGFLLASALYWLREFHLDGLRVDAVASMLYLDYSKQPGEWVPNIHGGRENLEAIAFLRQLNLACYTENPGIMMMAEESTAFPSVSRPTDQGGLGFGFKWNMGWMHDFLVYMAYDPIHRRYHHGEATFSMAYAFNENFVLPLSHDEVVHGKGSLIRKMPGDRWQQFANLRLFLAWMYAHPGKKLLFQGSEFAQDREWSHQRSLDWHLLHDPLHFGIKQLVSDLNGLYQSEGPLHELDHQSEGFQWIDYLDSLNSTFSFLRRSRSGGEILVIVNATPVPRQDYQIGVPHSGYYREILNTDAGDYGGSQLGNLGGVASRQERSHGHAHSLRIVLPPLTAVFFRREPV